MRLHGLEIAVLAAAWLAVAAEAQDGPRGGDIFDSACAHCHGVDGQGGPLGPSILAHVADTDAGELAAFLRVGRPELGMPPAPVTGDEMDALVGYLRFLGSAASAGAAASEDAPATRAKHPRLEAFRLVTAATLEAPADADWLGVGRTRGGRGYSPLAEVSTANVERLALAWSRGLPEGDAEAMPIVYAGVLYVVLPDGAVAALDAATGDVLWQHAPGDGDAAAGRGELRLSGDTLHFVRLGSPPLAFDARTGERRADAPPVQQVERETIEEAALATGGGLIFRGGGDRRFRALDAETGDLLWETILGGPISAPAFAYAVDGRQHVAVFAGRVPAHEPAARERAADDAASSSAPAALYVFALPAAGEQDPR